LAVSDDDVALVRRFYAAFSARDLEAVEACLAPDVVWHLPGRSAIAGEHRGWAAIRDDFLVKLGTLSGGTFRAELIDLLVGDEHVVALQRATAAHEGRHLDVGACQLIRVRDGRIVDVRGHYSDQYAVDGFWGPG
jgi:ketosteroid isomerase-like protein